MSEFREVGGVSKYINVAPKGVPAFKAGEVMIEGTFTRTFEGKFGLQHEFKVGTDTMVVNGFGSLNHKLEKVDPNNLVRIVYEGVKVLEKGKYAGRKFHDCKVLVANASATTTEPASKVNKEVATDSNEESFLD